MKFRTGYVSNSSSSSFIIFNWFDLSEEKRNYIMNYDNNAVQVWKDNNIKYNVDKNNNPYFDGWGFDKEFSEYKNITDEEYDKLSKYFFGNIFEPNKWKFEENKKRNTCTVSNYMDNFDMETWLNYNNVDFEQLES